MVTSAPAPASAATSDISPIHLSVQEVQHLVLVVHVVQKAKVLQRLYSDGVLRGSISHRRKSQVICPKEKENGTSHDYFS